MKQKIGYSSTKLILCAKNMVTSKTSRSEQHRAELDAAEAFDAAVVTSDVLSVEFCSKYSDNVASAVSGDGDFDSARNKTRYNAANWLLHLSPIHVTCRPSRESWLPWNWRRGRRMNRALQPWSPARHNLDQLHLLSTLVEQGHLQVRKGVHRSPAIRRNSTSLALFRLREGPH